MPHVQLKKRHNYFISSAGYVFKIENGEEKVIPAWMSRSKKLIVEIDRRQYELIYLMLEHFDIKFTPADKIKFTISSDLRIPLGTISVKPFLNKYSELQEEDERLLYKFKCDTKANAANQRSEGMITPLQVFYSLKIHEYKCVYCGRPLEPEIWHLDHFMPLSKCKKGNRFENIVPSCSKCNIMKGALDGNQFYAQCRRIAENCFFAGKDILEAPLVSSNSEESKVA